MTESQSDTGNRSRTRQGPAERARFRPRRARWIAFVCAVAVLAVSSVMAAFLQQSDTGVNFRVSDQFALVGVGIILACGFLLLARPFVDADSQGVRVRNVLFTQRFGWDEILAVSFPDGASFARLELPEDEYYSVLAVQALDRHHAVDAVRTLRRLHKRAHASYHRPDHESGAGEPEQSVEKGTAEHDTADSTAESPVTEGGTRPE